MGAAVWHKKSSSVGLWHSLDILFVGLETGRMQVPVSPEPSSTAPEIGGIKTD